MTDQAKQQDQPQGLTCPLCLSDFKNPTLLRCGHTFCKVCLENYDEQQYGRSYMECPVCRKCTKLERDRIAGLSPNFSLKGLQDELKFGKDIHCPIHRKEDKNIFCELCGDFICITCFIETHQGHKIKSKVELGEELKKQRLAIIKESEAGKTKLDEICIEANQQRKEIQCYIKTIKKEIEDAFAKKYTTLQENENNLIKQVNMISTTCDSSIIRSKFDHLDLIRAIDTSVAILKCHESLHLQNHVLKEHYQHCMSLENTLKKIKNFNEVKQQYMTQVQVAVNTKFYPAQDTLLDVGHIKVGEVQPEKTTPLGSPGDKEQTNRRNSNCSDSSKKHTFDIMLQEGKAGDRRQEVKKTASVTENHPGDEKKGLKVKTKSGKEVTEVDSVRTQESTLSGAKSAPRSSEGKRNTAIEDIQELSQVNHVPTLVDMIPGPKTGERSCQQVKTISPENSPGGKGKGGKVKTKNGRKITEKNAVPSHANMLPGSKSVGGMAEKRSSQDLKKTAPVTTNSLEDKEKRMGKLSKKQANSDAKCTCNPETTLASTLPGGKSVATCSISQLNFMPENVKSPDCKRNEGKAMLKNVQAINNTLSTLPDDASENTPSTSRSDPSTTFTAAKISLGNIQPCTRGNAGAVLSTVKTNSLTIVKEVESGGHIYGIGALSSSSVVVGHGCLTPSSECISLLGERKPHLNLKEAGGIACLANGKIAVSCRDYSYHIYNAEGSLDKLYCIPKLQSLMSYPRLCGDQHGDIYVVTGDSYIRIFNNSDFFPKTVIPTGKVRARHVSVAKTGAIIMCGITKRKTLHPLQSVTVYNSEGHTGSSIKSYNMMIEHMYAAVDSQDRVIVARMKDRSNTIRLTRYTLQELTLFKEVTFKPLTLPSLVNVESYMHRGSYMYNSSCMVSLSPTLIVFSYSHRLYFIELPQ
ncbi:uncharacterized protein LOC121416241 [Lytechinus variegatus]|uniref:uncharacterized protein LOC121416241 n=1 Tax=Lytechinus variegatus TaxID=7654 RepID=UPI001BB10E28|nr:uncharacterized protein LOC121416241 [Lytechinus variegatus]XP_041465684.1 uncharacterized protein LOC121416241 [Lytechinus variegatus]